MQRSNPTKKTLTGKVVSDKMEKTVTVQVETRKMHPIYKKFVRSHKKFKAHDEKNEAAMGDMVTIKEIRPLSREKCWKVVEIIEKAQRG
ncbi:MAG: 30S ribosomal protein S17 [Candidatus Omnitrophica bacterium]|nr:30S ribosomal protein S17 [Candidatus Omnitrophota bacterium]